MFLLKNEQKPMTYTGKITTIPLYRIQVLFAVDV